MYLLPVLLLAFLLPTSAKCPPGSKLGTWPGHSAYECYSFQSHPADFATAAAECVKMGGILTSLRTEQESISVNRLPTWAFEGYWVGIKYLDWTEDWGWEDDYSFAWTNWAECALFVVLSDCLF